MRSVTYRLTPPSKTLCERCGGQASNPNCLLQIWTWGLFEIEATIEDKFGKRTRQLHDLGYGCEIERAPQAKFREVS